MAVMSYVVSCHITGRKWLHSKAFQKLYVLIGQNCATWLPPTAGDSKEASVLAGYTAIPYKISALLVRKRGKCTVNNQPVVVATKDLNGCSSLEPVEQSMSPSTWQQNIVILEYLM